MKFVEAIRAMKPGQLLCADDDSHSKFEMRNGDLYRVGSDTPWMSDEGWQVIDKPRPKVDFATAMRAALDGKVIRALHYGHSYRLFKDGFYRLPAHGLDSITSLESAGQWEILDEAATC